MQVRDSTAGVELVSVPPRSTVNPAMMAKRVFLALPWQKNTNPLTAFSIANLLDRRRMSACLNHSDAFVSHSRNTCADLFLESDAEFMLMVDDDIVLPSPGGAKWFNANTGLNIPEKFANVNVVDRLLSHNQTLVGALYFSKHEYGRPMYCEGCSNNPAEEDYARGAPYDVCKVTKWCATGCLLIARSVFLDIEKKFPRLARNKYGRRSQFFSAGDDAAHGAIEDSLAIFNRGRLDGETALKVFQRLQASLAESKLDYQIDQGEDVVFAARARKAGHLSHVDMGLVVAHAGMRLYGPGNTRRKL